MRWSRARREPELSYVFVMTYGRSGSTLVMGLLNSIEGYLVRGENRHALRHLYEFHRSGVRERDRVAARRAARTTHPWFGIEGFDEQASFDTTRRLVLDTLLRPGPRTRVTGFKEIRWYDEDLVDYVAWLRQVFPGARFVVNTRHLPDAAQSAFWRQETDALARLQRIEERILACAADLGEAAYRVHYDDYVADPETLRGLFEWLGEPFDPATVREVMAVRHSIDPKKRADRPGPVTE